MCNFALCGPPYAGVHTRAPPAPTPLPSPIAIAIATAGRETEPAETHSRRTDRLPRLPRRRQLPARLACPALHGKGERIAIPIGGAHRIGRETQRPRPITLPERARTRHTGNILRSTRLQAPRPEPDRREPQLRQRRSRSIVRRRRLRRPAAAWLGAGRCRGAARGSGEAASPAASLRLRSSDQRSAPIALAMRRENTAEEEAATAVLRSS